MSAAISGGSWQGIEAGALGGAVSGNEISAASVGKSALIGVAAGLIGFGVGNGFLQSIMN